ncbi:hypothetical protein QOZ80_3BG0281220 [Eleusine coracana subsp. coracana]|nr:hypothetical protein QOZ80_3BG0280930 [Eleusine coracana subsp. coracana]KAK3147346.1 hypothetical protein QOZ80_3BG0281220 [Eleusine coracana subsp. coracana]
MAVYYRYRSGVETFSVPVAAPSISVSELKRLILGSSRHGNGRTRGRGPRESVALSDAQTGEEYTDDTALVPRGYTVLVRRVAGGPPAEAITIARSSSGSTSSSGAEDDEDRAISAVIDAAKMTWDDHRRPSQTQLGGRYHCYVRAQDGAQQEQRPTPPAGYVCHRCRVPGHFIQHCPTNGDPNFDFGKRRASSCATTTTNLPAPPQDDAHQQDDDGVPPELHCKICKKVMAEAVVTGRCCFDSFCDACIRAHVISKSKCVCGAQASADDLIPNKSLRVTIANMLLPTRASGVLSDNQHKSSAGSNEEATSQVTAGSQKVIMARSEQGKGSASSSTSKSAATPTVVSEPRTKQVTPESTAAQTMAGAGYYPEQFDYGATLGPACYGPFFGGMPWPHDPYMYHGYGGVPAYGGGYHPMAPVPAEDYRDGRHGRKRKMDPRFEEPGFKKRWSRSLVPV